MQRQRRRTASRPARRRPHGRSIATVWDETAVAALRAGRRERAGPGARPLRRLRRDVATPGRRARASRASARDAAISYAAYRVLLWRRVVRLEPEPNVRAADERAALALLLAGLHDARRKLAGGAREPDRRGRDRRRPARRLERVAALRRPDASRRANQPLIVHAAGSTVEDATFWQPLALGTIQPHSSLTAVPADVQSFVGAEWGHVRGFALPRSRRGLPDRSRRAAASAIPSSAAYKQRGGGRPAGDLGERSGRRGLVAADLEPRSPPRAGDRRISPRTSGSTSALNGALNDAAVATWGAKRAYQAPRPISMIRYLAFQGQSSDREAAALQRRRAAARPGPRRAARRQGRGALAADAGSTARAGRRPSPTPASPGGVAEGSAFAYAAGRVLDRAHRPLVRERRSARRPRRRVADGIDVPSDVTGGSHDRRARRGARPPQSSVATAAR